MKLSLTYDQCDCFIAAGLKDTPKEVVLERTFDAVEGTPGLPQLLK